MLQSDLHHFRKNIQPGMAVVDLTDRFATRFEHPVYLLNQLPRIGGVLDDAVREDEIERTIPKRQMLAVGDAEFRRQPLLSEIRSRKLDRRRREIDAGDRSAAFREPDEIDARAASDVEYRASAAGVERHQSQQVVKLLEMVLIQVVEETTRSSRVRRDLEIVYVLIPVVSDLIDRRHAGTILSRS